MAKKLKVELDVETSKAKSKVAKDLGGAVDGAGGGGGAASSTSSSAARLEKALSRAAKGAEDFGKETAKTGVNLSNAFESLAGFGAGMAINWAAHLMPEGSGRNYVEKAGSAVQGASAGLGAAEFVPGGNYIKLGAAALGGLAGYAAKLSNPNFVERAPAKVVEEEKKRQAEALANKAKVEEALARIANL